MVGGERLGVLNAALPAPASHCQPLPAAGVRAAGPCLPCQWRPCPLHLPPPPGFQTSAGAKLAVLEEKSIGASVSVYWPLDDKWYTGVVSKGAPTWRCQQPADLAVPAARQPGVAAVCSSAAGPGGAGAGCVGGGAPQPSPQLQRLGQGPEIRGRRCRRQAGWRAADTARSAHCYTHIAAAAADHWLRQAGHAAHH